MKKAVLVAFFESIKYLGHLFPLALLRVYIGYFYINQALERYGSDFLVRPVLAETALHWLPRSLAPQWYSTFIENILVPNWQIFALAIVVMELLIGISYVLGYFVRPLSILGFFLSLNMLWIYGPESADLYRLLIAIFLTMAWLGAGRCLGMDYFFYKRQRGIWW
ncbi:MAG: DoxX family membrane protein [Bdellovibrionales bacterium]